MYLSAAAAVRSLMASAVDCSLTSADHRSLTTADVRSPTAAAAAVGLQPHGDDQQLFLQVV